MAFIALASATETDSGGGNWVLDIAKPTGTLNDHEMTAVLSATWDVGASFGFTPLAGWTIEQEIQAHNATLCVMKKIAASEGSSYSFALPREVAAKGVILTYDNINTTTPVGDSATANSASATNHIAPSVAPVAGNCMLVCVWLSETSNTFFAPGSMTTRHNSIHNNVNDKGSVSLLVCDQQLSGTGGSGNRLASTFVNCSHLAVTIALQPNGPTAPDVTAPAEGGAITIGRTFTVDWSDSVDPIYASNLLTYTVDYSDNNQASWSNITTTAAGVTSASWNTTGRTAGTDYYIRVKANNPGALSSSYGYSGKFRLNVDAAPNAPTNLVPGNGDVIAGDQEKLFTWQFNDAGDTKAQSELRVAVNGGGFTPYVIAGTAVQRLFAAGTWVSGDVLLWDVRDQDTGGSWSARSAQQTVQVSDAPDPPTIISPANGSTVSDSQPTIIWTPDPTVPQTAYEVLSTTTGDVEEWDSGEISSAATSKQIGAGGEPQPFLWGNGTTHKAKVRTKNQYGLWSLYSSVTVNVTYTPPTVPTFDIVGNVTAGQMELTITNTGSLPAYNEVWRYVITAGIATAIRIATGIAPNSYFYDTLAAPGILYGYFIRAVSSTLAFADSITKQAQVDLDNSLYITNTATGELIKLFLIDAQVNTRVDRTLVPLEGRGQDVAFFGTIIHREYTATIFIPEAEIDDFYTIIAMLETGVTVRLRDYLTRANAMYATYDNVDHGLQQSNRTRIFTIQFNEVYYKESV